jgi:hypothetical protein
MATAYDQQQRRQPSAVSSFIRWLKLKNYQYEVTFSLYMLSPTERIIFSMPPCHHLHCARLTFTADVIILTLFSLLVTAASMYLPDHMHQIYTRIWYYLHGNTASAAQAVKATVAGVAQSSKSLTSTIPAETAAEMLKKLKEL